MEDQQRRKIASSRAETATGTGTAVTGVHSLNRAMRLATADGRPHVGGPFYENRDCVPAAKEKGKADADRDTAANAGPRSGTAGDARQQPPRAVLHHYRLKSEIDGERRLRRDISNFKSAGELANKQDDYAFSNEALGRPYSDNRAIFEHLNAVEDTTGAKLAQAMRGWWQRGAPNECSRSSGNAGAEGGRASSGGRGGKSEL